MWINSLKSISNAVPLINQKKTPLCSRLAMKIDILLGELTFNRPINVRYFLITFSLSPTFYGKKENGWKPFRYSTVENLSRDQG